MRHHAPHVGMQRAVLAAMPFVHENEQVGAVQCQPLRADSGLELIDDGGDHRVLVALQKLDELLARTRALGLQSAAAEGVVDLIVQVHAVGHQHHFLVRARNVLSDRRGEHHHGERLTASLRMPHHATRTLTVGIRMADAVRRALDAEVLLIPGDLLLTAIVQDETLCEFHQAIGTTEGKERSVLGRDFAP